MRRVLLFALLVGTATALGGAGAARPTGAPEEPFHAGEALEYRVSWSGLLTAATVEFRAAEQRNFYGRAAWHLQATAHTVEPMRTLYPLDDQFDSYADTAGLRSRQYERYLHENGRDTTSIARFAFPGEPAWGNGPDVVVPAGTRDPLLFFYWLRTVDWTRTRTAALPVYDSGKIYQVEARLAGWDEAISVPAGDFRAQRIEIEISQEGRRRGDVHFTVWLSQDAAHTPVRVTAEVPLGTARVVLVHAGG